VAHAQESASGPPPVRQPLPVAFSADEVRLDVRAGSLVVSGDVRVDEPPFYFSAGALELRRVPIGVELRGSGRVSFCHCLGSPVAVRFTGATVAPPHDAILRNPVLEIFGVPVAWLPLFWLRSSGRVGVLAPEVAWRGRDGLFLGEGIHVPWAPGDREHGLDLRAGGYVDGGVVVAPTLATPATVTRVRWDRLRGDDGVGVDALGSTAAPGTAPVASVAWSVEALRGARAVQATTDVDAAARRVDRASAGASVRLAGWTFASEVRAAATRGGDVLDLGAVGPALVARRADALGRAGAYALTLEGGEIAGAGSGVTAFARGLADLLTAAHLGPLGVSLAVRAFGDVAQSASASGWDGAAQARAAVTLPLERAYASTVPADPWRHRTEPRIEAAVLATHVDDLLDALPGPGTALAPGRAWVLGAGWSNAFGRFASRDAAEVDVMGGAAGAMGGGARALPAIRARASAGQTWVAARADFARVFSPAASAGGAASLAARVGAAGGLHLAAHVAERDGIDPVVARALVDPPFEPESRFFDAAGWTAGARLGIPLGSRVTASGGADFDLDARELVDAGGALEVHDPCGCVVVRTSAAHRIGRPGVDVWVAVDVPAVR